jgi:YidC/Oxa1 family membrane protein insertase
MFANIFTTIIIQPIFNLLVLIYALIPGHNFGLAIVMFTVIVRLLMWPLVKKQIRQAKAMRELQPEIKKIKAAAKGNRQKESAMTMELYRERGVNPMASLGIVIVQLPILLGLYISVRKIVANPHEIVTFSYPFVQHLTWIKELAANIHLFDDSFLGVINLGQKALGPNGLYWPALLLVAASAVAQFFQARQLMPQSKDARGLRTILRDAGSGKAADQAEVNAAVGRGTQYLIPGFVFIFGMGFPAALPLYWLTSSLVAYAQQSRVLREDVEAADASIKVTTTSQTKEAKAPTPAPNKNRKTTSKKAKRRRR